MTGARDGERTLVGGTGECVLAVIAVAVVGGCELAGVEILAEVVVFSPRIVRSDGDGGCGENVCVASGVPFRTAWVLGVGKGSAKSAVQFISSPRSLLGSHPPSVFLWQDRHGLISLRNLGLSPQMSTMVRSEAHATTPAVKRPNLFVMSPALERALHVTTMRTRCLCGPFL